MSIPLKILIIEDSDDDVLLVLRHLRKGGYEPEFERVETAEAMRKALKGQTWDLVLCDYKLPRFDGLHALDIYRGYGLDIPFIIVSGAIGDTTAVSAMKSGAHDYVMKDNLTRLVPVIERELGEAKSRAQRRRVEDALRDSEEELSAIYENAPIMMILIDVQWKVRKANAFVSRLTGKSLGDLTELCCGDALCCLHALDVPEGCGHGPSCSVCTLRLLALETIETGLNHHDREVNMSLCDRGTERKVTFLVSTRRLFVKGEPLALVSIQDITDRKTAENRQAFTNEILAVLNSPGEMASLIRKILILVRDHTGIEAAGIRLREGSDYPYYETDGFPSHFVETERFLCTRDESDKIIRDLKGNPYIECMCGNIIRGRTDPSLPFFTTGGSFWTNSSSLLLASTMDEERQARTRNRCHGEGYESVALIPLKTEDEMIGLLQLNDRRRDRFSLDLIHLLEGIGNSIGIAISRQRLTESLDVSLRFQENLIASLQDGFSMLNAEGVHILVNDAFCAMTGFSREELLGKGLPHPYWPPEERQAIEATLQEVTKRGSKEFELIFMRKSGERFPVILTPSSITDEKGNTILYATVKDITDRKKAEKELRDREDLLRETGQMAKVGGWQLDARTGEIRWTEETYRIHEVSPEQKPLLEEAIRFFHPDDRDRLRDAIGKALENGESYDMELRFITATGRNLWTRTICKPETLHGKVIRLRGTFQDITDRKKAEQSLSESEMRYRDIFDHAVEGIFQSTPEGRFIRVNPAYALIFGYDSPEEMMETVEDIATQIYVDPEDRKRNLGILEQEGVLRNFECRCRRKDGSVFWVSINSRFVITPEGNTSCEGFVLDITDRRLAEENLRERDTRYQKLSQHVPGMIYQFLRRGDGTYCVPFSTEAIRDIFGCSPEDVREDFSPIARVIVPEDLERLLESIESSAENLTTWQYEYRAQLPGQSVRWLIGHATPEALTDGGILWHGFNTDITERRRIMDELIQSREEMRALAGRLRDVREEERRRIARAIHDEMGQALTGIKMDLHWVQQQLARNGEVDRRKIKTRLESMGDLADVTIREMRRIITDLRPGVLDDLGLVAALEWLVQDFRNRTKSECTYETSTEEIEADPEKAIAIFRIAQEAMFNIVRHSGAEKVFMNLHVEDGVLLLHVTDNGRGFSKEDTKKWGAFGMLGMKERALAIGGAVEIRSTPGIGTTVSLRVPLVSPDQQKEGP